MNIKENIESKFNIPGDNQEELKSEEIEVEPKTIDKMGETGLMLVAMLAEKAEL